MTGADGTELANRLAASQSVRLNIRIVADAWPCEPRNVVAEIPGSGPEGETVIFCAHLDSWHLGEGAIDNGNGSVAILEAARALAAVSWRPRRTVRFIWFMGEEHGLFGSEAYVAAHAGELDKIVAVVNADMPGSPRQFAVFGHPEIVNWLQSVGADLAGLEISGEIADASWTASDHGPFMKQGVCAIALSGDLGEGVRFYHAAGDSYEVVDRRGTNLSAAAFAVVARRLADVSPRPTVRLDPAKLAELRRWDES